MQKIIEKRNYLILIVIILLLIWILTSNRKTYVKSFEYFDETITYKIYTKVNHKKVTKDINNIYKKYTDYKKQIKSGKMSEDVKNLVEYGKILYYKTDGYVDITKGDLVTNLKQNKEYKFTTKIDQIDDNIENISFNFDDIIASYATNDVIYYFKQNDIDKYIVNENGDITTGKHYDNKKYKISINNPVNNKILKIVTFNKKAMATRSNSDTFKSYMANPKTSQKENKYETVVVIAGDNLTANMLVNALYIMDKEEGKKLLNEYHGEALWLTDEIEMTDGFKKYVKKIN